MTSFGVWFPAFAGTLSGSRLASTAAGLGRDDQLRPRLMRGRGHVAIVLSYIHRCIQNSKPVLVILYWNLRFVCNLMLGVWDFIYSITPAGSCQLGPSIPNIAKGKKINYQSLGPMKSVFALTQKV